MGSGQLAPAACIPGTATAAGSGGGGGALRGASPEQDAPMARLSVRAVPHGF